MQTLLDVLGTFDIELILVPNSSSCSLEYLAQEVPKGNGAGSFEKKESSVAKEEVDRVTLLIPALVFVPDNGDDFLEGVYALLGILLLLLDLLNVELVLHLLA
jgi:hypothetical protein